jgi:uncharacterized damage-inducible protein DinB
MSSDERVVVWPELELDEVEASLRRSGNAFESVLTGSTDLTSEITYVNSLGQSWKSNVGDVLMHVVMHGVHHRAQIASELRASGFEPPYVDFIHGVRTAQF